MLTPEEEVRVSGRIFAARERRSLPRAGTLHITPPPSSTEEVRVIVEGLRGLLGEKPACAAGGAMPGCSEDAGGETEISRRMWRELRDSWDTHRAQPTVELAQADTAGLEALMRSEGEKITSARRLLEQVLPSNRTP